MPLAAQELRTYFVTTVCHGRRRCLQSDQSSQLFVDVLNENRAKGRMLLHAYVVMPDHVHMLLTPASELSMEKIMQFIKGGFSFRHRTSGTVWEHGFFDKRVPDADAYEKCVSYIEMNPVQAGFVSSPGEWAYSSFGRLLDATPAWMRKAQG